VMDKNYAKSEQLFQQAARAAEGFGPHDARLGTTLNNLGLVYKEEKKYSEAESVFHKALAVLENVYGPDSLDSGNVCFNIASVITAGGRYDAALPYIQRSRAIYLSL